MGGGDVTAELRQILDEEVTYAYQPVVDLKTRATLYVEALARWNPDGTPASTADLLANIATPAQADLLTRTGLRQVLATDLKRLKQIYGPEVRVGFNLSALQFVHGESAVKMITAELERHNVAPSCLCIEVVEDLAASEASTVVTTLQQLRELGVKVMLDDFGTRASSLSALTDLTYDAIKIDRSFVASLRTESAARGVVEALVSFGRSNNIEIIAEGVENALELSELERLGVRFVQGDLFGKAAGIDALRPQVPVSVRQANTQVLEHGSRSPEYEDVARRIAELDPALSYSLPSEFKALEAACLQLGPSGDELLTDLFAKMAESALYASAWAKAVDWGLTASRRAEEEGRLGVAARQLALVAAIPSDSGSRRFVGAEALARCLRLRRTGELDLDDLATLDNSLGGVLALLGMVDRSAEWWHRAVRARPGTDCRGDALAATNLAIYELDRIETGSVASDSPAYANAVARIESSLDKLAESTHAIPGVAASLLARYAVVQGDTDRALELLEPWQEEAITSDVIAALLLNARAAIAQALGDAPAFLQYTEQLCGALTANGTAPHQRIPAEKLHIEALMANGRVDDAFKAQRAVLDVQESEAKRQTATIFDWLHVRAEFDVQFAHLLDFLGYEGPTGPEQHEKQ